MLARNTSHRSLLTFLLGAAVTVVFVMNFSAFSMNSGNASAKPTAEMHPPGLPQQVPAALQDIISQEFEKFRHWQQQQQQQRQEAIEPSTDLIHQRSRSDSLFTEEQLEREQVKAECEISYWKKRRKIEKQSFLTGRIAHYEEWYTERFGLTREFYRGKKILDIGCGPQGSLEWADMALVRVGLDPLILQYGRDLDGAIQQQNMLHVNSRSESLPFPSRYFDVVFTMNALDHVMDADMTLAEVARVLKDGGTFLIAVDVNHKPTRCEPITFTWDIEHQVESHGFVVDPVNRFHWEKPGRPGHPQSTGIGKGSKTPFDHNNPLDRYGVFAARFTRKSR